MKQKIIIILQICFWQLIIGRKYSSPVNFPFFYTSDLRKYDKNNFIFEFFIFNFASKEKAGLNACNMIGVEVWSFVRENGRRTNL